MSVTRERYEVGDNVEINIARRGKPPRWVPATVSRTDVRTSGVEGFIGELVGLKRATVRISEGSKTFAGEEAVVVNSLDRRDIRLRTTE